MALCLSTPCHAQSLSFDDDFADFNDFVKSITADFDDFRQQAMSEFTEFLKNPWKEFQDNPPVPKPVEPPVPPVVLPEEDIVPPIEDNPVVIEDVIEPVEPTPQPEPIAPIEEVPVVQPKYVDFTFFGTKGKVRYADPGLPAFERENLRDVINALKVQYGYRTQREMLKDLKYTSPSYISDFLSGTRPITPQFVKLLAATFGVNPDYIYNGKRPIFTEIKSVGERQAETGNQVDTSEEQLSDNPSSGPAPQPNIIPLTLGGRIVGEIELTDVDSRFKDSISTLPKESIEALLIGYHNLAEEYYKRWSDCNAELTKVKEANKVLGEIVKKHLIIDTD